MNADSVVFFGGLEDPQEMKAEPYEFEEHLEDRLARSPSLLAGAQMNPDDPRRWVLVRRQFPIHSRDGSSWAVDILFLDQDGIPTLVEVKRADNRELRRSVVGQILDYSAGLRYGPLDSIRTEFENLIAEGHIDVDCLEHFLGLEADPEEFWREVADNVSRGRIRMVFAADRIPPDLKAVTEYLNEQLSLAEVFALGVVQYCGSDGQRVLVPQLAGATSAALVSKGRSQPVGPGYEALLSAASEDVRQSEELLTAWSGFASVQSRISTSARIWKASDGKAVARLYPAGAYMEIELRPLLESGMDSEVGELLARIHAVSSTRKSSGQRIPSITCADIVANWKEVREILDHLVALRGG